MYTWMKTLGSLARHGLKIVCILILLTLATPTHARTIRTTSASAVRAAQTVCPTGVREKELFEAIKQKDSARVKALLAEGVSANARSIINYESWESSRPTCATALMHAARVGDAGIVESLLAAKADVNATDGWERHVWGYAVGRHTIRMLPPARLQEEMDARLQIIKTLLAAGAQLEAQDPYDSDYYYGRETALFHAAAAGVLTGDLRILQTVIAAGASVKDTAVLAYATRIAQEELWNGRNAPGAAEVVKTLLAASANVNGRRGNTTALMLEAYGWELEGSVQRIKVLLAAGADANAQNAGAGETALLNVLQHRDYQYEMPDAKRQAAAAAWVEIVKLLLAAGADPNKSDKEGNSPLPASFNPSWAAHFPSESEVVFKALVAAGADINSKNRDGGTILSRVASESFYYGSNGRLDSVPMLRTLIAAGADVNAPNKERRTPLLLVTKWRPKDGGEVFRTLIAARADVNLADNNGETPLMATLTSGDYYNAPQEVAGLIRLLFDAGANVNAKNRAGDSPLTLALTAGAKVEIIRTLLDAGADVNLANNSGEHALTVAVRARWGDEVIQALLAAGSRVNSSNVSGDTALMVVAKQYGNNQYYQNRFENDLRLAKTLVKAGADVRLLNHEGESALTIMAMKASVDGLPFIRVLLPERGRDGAGVYPRAVDLLVAIRRAAGNSTADVVRELIAEGADVNATDELGRPALLVAAGESGNPAVVRALLAAGASVNAKSKDGDTALTAAVREYLPGEDEFIKNALRRNTEVVRVLLDAGADPRVRGKDGRSALKLAGESGNKILIGMLDGAARR
jgi:ankyrin repeat protein